MTKAHERLDENGNAKLVGLLPAGDPKGEVAQAWHVKEVVRSIYAHTDPIIAGEWVDDIARRLPRPELPIGGPVARTHHRPLARADHRLALVPHHQRPTEAENSLIKRIKRVGLGFTNFDNYRIRVLPYAGRPNWDLLPTITSR